MELILAVLYLAAGVLTGLFVRRKFPYATDDDHFLIGFLALFWPLTLVVQLFIGALWVIVKVIIGFGKLISELD